VSQTKRASSVIEAHRDLVLSNEVFDRFLAQLDKPAMPVPEPVKLFCNHPKLPEAWAAVTLSGLGPCHHGRDATHPGMLLPLCFTCSW
jgi:hypothetical protein